MSSVDRPQPKLQAWELERMLSRFIRLQVHPAAYGAPTVRRYPRSTAEAFPCERAIWLEHHRRPPKRAHAWLKALAVAAVVALIFAGVR